MQLSRHVVLLGVVGLHTLASPAPIDSQATDPFDPAIHPKLSTTELTRIGGYDERPAYTFSRITAGAVLSTQEIALVDRLGRDIRVFDLAGNHLRSFGGEGQGPGEFMYLSALQTLAGDRLMAWDRQAKRFSVFTHDGVHVSTATLSRSDIGILWADFAGAFPDGTVVLRHRPNEMALRGEPAGRRIDPTMFVRYSDDGRVMDTLSVVPGPEKYLYHENGQWGLTDRLFERSVVGVILGDHLIDGETSAIALRRTTADGDEAAPLVYQRLPRPVSKAEVEAERDRRIEAVKAAEERRSRAGANALGVSISFADGRLRRLANMEAYSDLPAFRSIAVGSDGLLWIEDYPSPFDQNSRWFMLRDDRILGWIELSQGERFLAAGEGLVLKLLVDEVGVESVVVLRVDRPDA